MTAMRRASRTAARSGAAALLTLAFACRSAGPPPEPTSATEPAPPPAVAVPEDAFSGERAFAHLVALSEIGPRPTGSEGAERAREYIRSQLEEAGMEVEVRERDMKVPGGDAEAHDVVNLMATLPGASRDLFVLIAHYDTPDIENFVGANESASGPAVVLELGRALAHRTRPYTIVLVFLDGEEVEQADGTSAHLGIRSLVAEWQTLGLLDRIRLAVLYERVGDVDLRIARDLLSHRMYREAFWRAAGQLGAGDAFPPDAEFEAVPGAHRLLLENDMRRAVLIADNRFGGDEPPGAWSRSPEDNLEHVSAQSLGTVGEVSLAAIDAIGVRLAKIDRFSRRPVEEEDADDTAGETPAPGGSGPDAPGSTQGEGAAPPAVPETDPADL